MIKTYKYLQTSNFSKEIANKSGKRVICLTKEASQTYNSFVELSICLLGTTDQYVMLENFNSDLFKKQFGKLRRG